MSNSISRYLAQILSAIRGEEVRGSIHDAIAECYDDVSTSKTIAENATAGAIAATESANEATAYANAAGDNAVASVKYFAPIFNDATPYRQNELVLHNGKLWKFVVAHPAGEWIGSDATEADISSEVANLKQAMNSNVEALAGDIQDVNSRIEDILLRLATKFDNAYLQDGYQSFESEGVVVCGPLGPFAGGGGGGGGSGDNNAVLTITNTSGWMSKTIAKDAECIVTLNWSSLENEMPTGNGSLRVTVSGTTKATTEVAQGDVQVDITNYLSAGANTVGLTITDIYGNTRTIRVSVTVIELVLMSSFDTTAPFTGPIYFPYTPRGSATKVVHFVLDGVEIGTVTTSVSDRQQNYVIPQQSHGAHNFRCYFESEINGETVRSNELYYEMICLESGNTTPIITSTYRNATESQYSTINIDYSVYNPTAVTSIVTISVNGTSELITEVDRNSHIFSYRAENAGTLVIEISTGTVGSSSYASKSWTITVSEVSIDVEAETEGLALYLNARGRSNGEATREEWTYNDISATLTGFNWRINGWLQDEDKINILRLSDDARVTIPYKIFQNDFKSTGKTIEIEFATRDVIDYSATIFSCVTQEENGRNVGLRITPQTVYFDGHQTSISTLYKENEHIRLSITVAKQNDYRLIQIYINGIVSRAIQYASGERFSQLNPVNISIGSDDCGIDIYNIRIYDQDLTPRQIVNNWIADTQIGTLMIDRYNRNNIFSQNGAITIETLTKNVPYMVIECPELPQFKGDEKTCTGRYVDPVDGKKSFTFEGCVINRQGTSSSIYYVANFDMKFKQGFKMTSSGNTAETYALKTGSIPFNRFVLKADVASSESANNTGLTSFYNDTCPYKTPEMVQNPKVRWGIEGVPIVLFWTNTDTGETTFQGKYNFNLPKRAPEPLGYSGNMESWEWERNNSENVKFQAADFTTMAWDEVKQEYYPAWYDDFEARFPSDEWRDTAKLGEFLRWVVSTDRTKASGDSLETPVVYELPTIATLSRYSDDSSYSYEEIKQDGVRTGYRITFTKDTPAYRLTKFRAEAPDYMEMASAEYYYLFTEMFTMIDSRAKNMFVGFNGSDTTKEGMAIDRKATFQPYDMDTAVGTNNSGVLMFGYALEDTDTVSSVISGEGGSNAPVYNAQDSVLWNNVRDAFRAEINAMYISLRTGNPKVWSYQIVENMYEQHQSKWSESVFNEDARAKYLVPLINPVTVDEETGRLVRTDRYLTMLQGSKTEQRKWWLYNRFRYMDSKFNTGDAERTINLRLFNEGTLTITPAIDMYACVRFGGGTTPLMERTTGGTPVSFAYAAPSGVTEMETWIYSADLIADVGDLSVFYPNELDFSRATRLRRLQVGSGAAGYSNTNLTTLNVQNSVLLEYIDCRNCPRLAIPVDLEGSPRLKEAYFDGTAITGVEIADGAPIETLHLPSTITALTLLNLNKLTELVIPSYSGISRVMLANMDPEIIDPVVVLNAIPANSQVNIQGLNLEMSTADDIEDFLDLLDTMVGVSRTKNDNGEWIYTEEEKAQVAGRIHTSALTGAQIASYNARYPYITVVADHTTSYLYYYNYDGSSLLYTETILDGGNGTWNGSPTRTSTAQYDYTFAGWSESMNASSASSSARQNVVSDRNVYAAYTSTVRKYTVTFARKSEDGGGTLQTVSNVPYGGTATYTGATPTTTQGSAEDYPFMSWSPAPTNITGNTTCYAVFGSPIEVAEISDSWETIVASLEKGTYATKYKVGNYKPLDLGTEGTVNMQIVAIDNEEAPLTFVAMELLSSIRAMNSSSTNANGYPATNVMKPFLNNTVYPLIPETLRNSIMPVAKTSFDATTNADVVSIEKVWIPSAHEIFGSYEKTGPVYNMIYKDGRSRSKYRANSASHSSDIWWLRTAVKGSNTDYRRVYYDNDSINKYYASTASGICLGFCLAAETISDSWEQIFAAEADGTYSTKYSIGQTKYLNLGSEGNILMQIVAFDADDLADGSGKAKITWAAKQLLKTTKKMNSTSTNANGYPATNVMRPYLNNTIYPLIPETVRNAIKSVTKTSYDYTTQADVTSSEKVWFPSAREMFGGTSYEKSGPDYTAIYKNNASRAKYKVGASSASYWWLRSADSRYSSTFRVVSSSGDVSYNRADDADGVCVSFCT